MPQEMFLPAVLLLGGMVTTLGAVVVNAIFGQPMPATAMTCTQIVSDAAVESQLIAQKNPAASAALTGTDVVGTVKPTPLPAYGARPQPTPAYAYDLKQTGGAVQIQSANPNGGNGRQRVCEAMGTTNAEGPAPNSQLTGNP